MDTRWKIHKFGGSSLGDADCFRRVAGLMLERDGARLGVVVSGLVPAAPVVAIVYREYAITAALSLMLTNSSLW